jgi:hypothetical protein
MSSEVTFAKHFDCHAHSYSNLSLFIHPSIAAIFPRRMRDRKFGLFAQRKRETKQRDFVRDCEASALFAEVCQRQIDEILSISMHREISQHMCHDRYEIATSVRARAREREIIWHETIFSSCPFF